MSAGGKREKTVDWISRCNVIAFIAGDRTISDALVKLMIASPNLLIVSNLACAAGRLKPTQNHPTRNLNVAQ